MDCRIAVYVPLLYTVFNKYGCVESGKGLLRYVWGYYIWTTLIHEFGGPSLLLIIHFISKHSHVMWLLIYGVWLIALLTTYEIGYIINDFFAYYEPINIRNLRLSKLFPFHNFNKIKRIVLQSILLRAALIMSVISLLITYSLQLAYMFTVIVLSIIFLFTLHSLIYSLLIRGLITEFSLRTLRVVSVIGFYSCSLARLALLFYSIAKGIAASYGYLSCKGVAKMDLTRSIELLLTYLVMMLGLAVVTYKEYLCYLFYSTILLLPSLVAVIIRNFVRSTKGE